MKKVMMLAVVVLLSLAVANVASAAVVQGIDIAFATIGNPSNPEDTRGVANPSGIGAVDYTYQPGKYEITNEVI
jgi:hypothetical protein